MNHKRERLWAVVKDVEQHLHVNGLWRYELSKIYYTPSVTAAVQALLHAKAVPGEISQLTA